VRHADNISIRLGRRGELAEFLIDDDGPGIPADKREDVFKPFFRLDASRNPQTGGVGLGMTIARDAIRGHGGDVLLEDAPGGGLRVRVSLPL
jgi:two-component system osmolarity sensor histidine kinase EnvZ